MHVSTYPSYLSFLLFQFNFLFLGESLVNTADNCLYSLIFFRKSLGGQNLAALFLYLESGHTVMEGNSMYSAIETAKKYVPVYTILGKTF